MADSGKTYSEAEYNALADQLAQLKAGMLGQQLLQFQAPQSILQGYGQQQQPFPGQVTLKPQGYETLPGAGAFGPQGVMFAGGSPWPVSARPAHTANAMLGLTQALTFLQRSGLLQKLLQPQAPQAPPINPIIPGTP